ncbi:DUF2182 domain-containing protein [Pseudomonas sp. Teo4]|uniref:copper chaperone n=1 Tax=Pseudomonas sp. Teo4 TaxID=3064528 RepID=UPI002ABAC878|nr:DUF2182 domain-containing protein [Pseudomonas sp. Teo4]MDZ3994606.1 hypothetical protein [Pseudomonas sp. Teo4]
MASTYRSRPPLAAWARENCQDPLKCALWAVSLAAFALMAFSNDIHDELESFCISGSPSMLAEGWVYVRLYYSTLDVIAFAAAMGLMLIAMMLPALQGPLRHLWVRSRLHQRGPAVVLFLMGYFCVWLLGCLALLTLALLLISFTGSQLMAGLLALATAVGWQFSGVKTRSLTRCHLHVNPRKTGLLERVGPVASGALHGLWCFTTCWPLMLIAFCLPSIHLPVMVVGAIFIAYERGDRKTASAAAPAADQ